MTAARLSLTLLTLASAAVSLVFSVRALRQPDPQRLMVAHYTVARSVALFAVAVVPLFVALDGWLIAVAVAMIVVQALDAVVGIARRDPVFTIGPAVTAAANGAVLVWFLTSG